MTPCTPTMLPRPRSAGQGDHGLAGACPAVSRRAPRRPCRLNLLPGTTSTLRSWLRRATSRARSPRRRLPPVGWAACRCRPRPESRCVCQLRAARAATAERQESSARRAPAAGDDEAIERKIAVRTARQERLTADDQPECWAVLNEAAIRRVVGGANVMRSLVHHPCVGGREAADAPEVPPGHCPARLTLLMSTVSAAGPGGYPGRADRRQG